MWTTELSYTVGRSRNDYNYFGKQFAFSNKIGATHTSQHSNPTSGYISRKMHTTVPQEKYKSVLSRILIIVFNCK